MTWYYSNVFVFQLIVQSLIGEGSVLHCPSLIPEMSEETEIEEDGKEFFMIRNASVQGTQILLTNL